MKELFEKVEKANIDALFISKIENVRYVTNFTGEDGFALVVPPNIYLIVDPRFTEQAQKEHRENVEVVEYRNGFLEVVEGILSKHKVHFLGIEEYSMEVLTYRLLLGLGFLVLVPLKDFVEELRMVKTEDELQKIKEACNISTKAFIEAMKFLKEGITEQDIAAELEYRFRKFGGEKPSFDTIVASGIRGSLPHGVASSKVIKAHEPIVFDFGVFYNGYASDTTRVVSIGEVEEEVKETYKIVKEAQQVGRDSVKVGILASDVDKKVRDFFKEKGLDKYFTHGLGHGVGLEIHELPYVNGNSKHILSPRMVITIEPGVYFEGKYGLRLEDTVIVREDGAENLIDLPHDIIVV
ncbi:MAG: aminopeptidase P family protein [Candidatus Atribacteria bacterium]|nr:aminopeptidase P family protein [Candidatus Atribacteria bacterium]